MPTLASIDIMFVEAVPRLASIAGIVVPTTVPTLASSAGIVVPIILPTLASRPLIWLFA